MAAFSDADRVIFMFKDQARSTQNLKIKRGAADIIKYKANPDRYAVAALFEKIPSVLNSNSNSNANANYSLYEPVKYRDIIKFVGTLNDDDKARVRSFLEFYNSYYNAPLYNINTGENIEPEAPRDTGRFIGAKLNEDELKKVRELRDRIINKLDGGNNSEVSNNVSIEAALDVEEEPLDTMSSSGLELPTSAYDIINGDNINTTNIEERAAYAIIYIQNREVIIKAYAYDEDSLNYIKNDEGNIFYKCREHVRNSALFISSANIIANEPLRLLSTEQKCYIPKSQFDQITIGKQYILRQQEVNVGRVASHDMVYGSGVAVSASHCGPAGPEKFFYVLEIVNAAGGRRRRRAKLKTRKHKKNVRKLKNKSRKAKGRK